VNTVGSAPTIAGNFIDSNTNAAGLYLGEGDSEVYHNIIAKNAAGTGGSVGGVFIFGGSPTVANNTIVENFGDGFVNDSLTNVTSINNIVYFNTASNVLDNTGLLAVTFSNVDGGYPGTGNIDVIPIFSDPSTNNYRVSFGSPEIDAGSNAGVPAGVTTDQQGGDRFLDDPDVIDTGAGVAPVVDMGALERNINSGCDSIDFNNDEVFPDTQDLIDFVNVFGGGVCSTGLCNDLDFNNDEVFPDVSDLNTFIFVFGGGSC
jgi:hypothetical protein